MIPVKASSGADPTALLSRFREIAPKQGFTVVEYGEIAGYPLLALTRRTAGVLPRIYLSAGSHGDEPAGPEALIKLLEAGFFDRRAVWFICPLLNPTGLARGTRENADGVDLNRDYRRPKTVEIAAHVAWLQKQPSFDLTFCLHEDWETSGFYLYELNGHRKPGFAEAMIQAVSTVCPIELSELIDGRPGKDGIIRPEDDPAKRELWPEAIYLRAHHGPRSYTTESPSMRPLPQRVAAQCLAVETAVRLLLEQKPA
ncbi:succinylglutamate desuccinylase [Opitutaceae bacterium EW11]|nr:succinylglutamate desuccinylase [Opitutaceae bacterium EW11]